MTEKELAAAIRDFFLSDGPGKWEVDEKGWLWVYDANYGFDPIDLARKLEPQVPVDYPPIPISKLAVEVVRLAEMAPEIKRGRKS